MLKQEFQSVNRSGASMQKNTDIQAPNVPMYDSSRGGERVNVNMTFHAGPQNAMANQMNFKKAPRGGNIFGG